MDNRWAWIVGIAVVGAIVWWYGGHPGYETQEQAVARVEALEQSRGGHLVYRWVDERGVTQFTDTPPKDRKFTEVRIPDDRNIVDMGSATPPPKGAPAKDKKR